MKNNLENEPLLNVIARQVGRAAGTVARATKRITGEENNTTAETAKPARSRKKARRAAAIKTAKKKSTKSRTRKSQPKTSSRKTKRKS